MREEIRDQIGTVNCMSLEGREWSISIVEQGEAQDCGDVIYLIVMVYSRVSTSIRASVDALCRDGTSEISRDPRTKRLQTRRESLAMPSKHTNNNF